MKKRWNLKLILSFLKIILFSILFEFIFAIIVSLLMSILCTVRGININNFENAFENLDFIRAVLSIIGCVITSIIVCLIVKKSTGIKIKERFDFKKINIKFLISIILFTIFGLGITIDWTSTLLFSNMIPATVIPEETYTGNTYVIMSIVSIVFVPLLEEITNRFALIEIMKKYKISSLSIIIFTSCIFSIAHGFSNLQLTISSLLAGVTFSIIYLHTNNILYGVICHAVNNALWKLVWSNCSSNVLHQVNGYTTYNTYLVIFSIIISIFALGVILRNLREHSASVKHLS